MVVNQSKALIQLQERLPKDNQLGWVLDHEGDYDVPEVFLNFINQHTGLDFTGNPVNEVDLLSEYVYRQCFAGLCLDHFAYEPVDHSVQPASLGYAYKNLYYQSSYDNGNISYPHEVKVRLWERYSLLEENQIQEIGIGIVGGNS